MIVRAGRGDKDRATMLPNAVVPFLQQNPPLLRTLSVVGLRYCEEVYDG
jgi:hypothetical protein